MADYLLFTLYSPMSSWGEIAVGEVRASKTHPGRSAIFGLIAASLGIKRTDSADIKNLHNGYGLGIKVISSGVLLKDFHTVTAAKSQKNVVYRTRADEVNADLDQQNTLISTREYRSDALYTAAIWRNENVDTNYSFQDIKNALNRPVYVPYMGRKSCPPACNFSPEIFKGVNSLKDAFEIYKVKPVFWGNEMKYQNDYYEKRIFQNESEFYYWDECDNHGFQEILATERYDAVTDASRRQFSSRREYLTIIRKERSENVSEPGKNKTL